MNDTQSFQGQKLIDFADGATFRSDQRGQPSRCNDLGFHSVLFLDTLNETVDETHIAKEDPRLDGVDGIPPHHFFRFHDFNSWQF